MYTNFSFHSAFACSNVYLMEQKTERVKNKQIKWGDKIKISTHLPYRLVQHQQHLPFFYYTTSSMFFPYTFTMYIHTGEHHHYTIQITVFRPQVFTKSSKLPLQNKVLLPHYNHVLNPNKQPMAIQRTTAYKITNTGGVFLANLYMYHRVQYNIHVYIQRLKSI